MTAVAIWTDGPGYLRVPGTIDVTPGVLDEAARHAYNNGQCHALAVALVEATGWLLVYVGDEEDAFHVLVADPHGHLVDVDGVRDVEDLCTQMFDDGLDVQALPPERLDAWIASGYFLPMDLDTARTFVPELLAQIQDCSLIQA